MLIIPSLNRVRPGTLLAVVIMIILLKPRGDHAQTELITLSAYPSGALSGGALCPDTSVYFNCTALNVAFLIWERNDGQIQDYTPRDNATLQPETINGYTLFLNSSTPVVGGRRNLTSTLVGIVGSSLQTGDRIECVDNTGPLITLNFTEISAPPVPTGFRNTITSQSSSLYFGFTWDTSFNVVNYVSTYRLMANDFSVACPEICSSSSDPCQCSGLKAGINVSINVSAISCGSLEGPAIVVDIAPQVPEETITCRGVRVYSYSGSLTTIQVIWNKIQDPSNITLGLSQEVKNYSVSINSDGTNISTLRACSNSSTECSFSYLIQTSATEFTVNVTAFNVVGGGPVSMCPLSTMNISQVFSLTLATTDPNNRMVNCTQLYQGAGTFRCEFCLSSSNTCYDLGDNTLANAALDLLEDGRYMYQVTVYINGVPVASISDNFSTSCQVDELGITNVSQANPTCDLNGGSIENGFVCYNGIVAESLATYMCNEGYTLTGTEQRLCGSDGRWSGDTPFCAVNDLESPYPQDLRTSLIVLTPIFCIISAAFSGIALILVLIYVQKPCSWLGFKESSCKLFIFFMEIFLMSISIILWFAYFSNQNGLSQGIALIVSFAFSVLLFFCSTSYMIITAVIFFRKRQNKDIDPPDNHRDK